MSEKQMVRQKFRDEVYARDNHTCVVPNCGKPAVDAHHIMERAMWKEPEAQGGYIPVNGVSVCDEHHRHAERDFFPPQALRWWAGIEERRLPKMLDPEFRYTKWGVKVTAPTPNSWDRIKYPHTPYLYISPSADEKDISEAGFSTGKCLLDKPLVVTTKMDGSNTLIDDGGVGARNTISPIHTSFDKLKARHLSSWVVKGFQLHGENLYAKHSIHYTDDLKLEDYFMLFAIYYKPFKIWLGWPAIEKWAERMGVPTVPVVDRFAAKTEDDLYARLKRIGEDLVAQGHEGFVVRTEYPFYYSQFKENVAKYVRKQHVQSDKHWSRQAVVKNEVARWSR